MELTTSNTTVYSGRPPITMLEHTDEEGNIRHFYSQDDHLFYPAVWSADNTFVCEKLGVRGRLLRRTINLVFVDEAGTRSLFVRLLQYDFRGCELITA